MIRKEDIVKQISKKFSITKKLSGEIMEDIIFQIKKELIRGNDVIINKLFTLSVKEVMGRTLVVPSTGEKSEAKLYKKLRCTFSRQFRDDVKKN